MAGDDTLVGDSGVDTANYGTATEAIVVNLNTTVAQTISASSGTDFLVGVDKLVVAGSSFGSLVLGALGATQYVAGTAPTANQPFAQFLYSTTTGQMAFDADGTGAASAVHIVTLLGLPALSAGDIWIGA